MRARPAALAERHQVNGTREGYTASASAAACWGSRKARPPTSTKAANTHMAVATPKRY